MHFHEISFNRHGMNPVDELKILLYYRRLIRRLKPAIVFTYTVKCNVYGGMAARHYNIPFCANITGLGITLNGGGIKERIVLTLYKIGLRDAQRVFFKMHLIWILWLDEELLVNPVPFYLDRELIWSDIAMNRILLKMGD